MAPSYFSRYFKLKRHNVHDYDTRKKNKIVIFAIACCHGNSLQYTHMNEKEIPGVLLIFTVNARSLNPKLKQILHF